MKVGGAQTHLVTMLRHLLQYYNYQHTVIGLFGDGPIADDIRNMGINVIIFDLRSQFRQSRLDIALNKIKSKLIELKPDLVEAHLTWSRLLGLLAARMAGVKKRFGFEQGDIYMNSFKFRIANYVSQSYTDRYIVCSNALGSWVNQTHHICKSKLKVLHNCVDIERFNQHISPAEDILRLKTPSNTLFAMVGTLGSGVNKRVDIGIQATAFARQHGADISLIIAGDGDQRSDLQKLAHELGIGDYIHFLGMRSDIPCVLRACDIFCHAAPFEPFGIVAIEAMATGLPAIVPNSGGIHEAVEDRVTGLIYESLNAEALGKAMIQLSQDQAKREEMGLQASKSIEDRFTVEQHVNQLYALYGLN